MRFYVVFVASSLLAPILAAPHAQVHRRDISTSPERRGLPAIPDFKSIVQPIRTKPKLVQISLEEEYVGKTSKHGPDWEYSDYDLQSYKGEHNLILRDYGSDLKSFQKGLEKVKDKSRYVDSGVVYSPQIKSKLAQLVKPSPVSYVIILRKIVSKNPETSWMDFDSGGSDGGVNTASSTRQTQ
ncbi:hypothetical protein J3R30DRAFT_3400476 [Lentinula aciculospora]|uniref:Uncharacterized protein n=1 Tax=Lentinula aciculospora TaxID=153920 RepID=A0A9W9DV18_9AGAR|nr:hypothetical protein J3R30DRAFT_3400476 [Lentinula aciculospora]